MDSPISVSEKQLFTILTLWKPGKPLWEGWQPWAPEASVQLLCKGPLPQGLPPAQLGVQIRRGYTTKNFAGPRRAAGTYFWWSWGLLRRKFHKVLVTLRKDFVPLLAFFVFQFYFWISLFTFLGLELNSNEVKVIILKRYSWVRKWVTENPCPHLCDSGLGGLVGGSEGQLEPWEFGGGFLFYCRLL